MATRPPELSVVIPVRNAARDLPRCLASVRSAGASADVEVIVVDNGSSDGSVEIATMNGCRLVRAPGVRVGAVRNAGAREARGRVVAFVDADNEVSPTWVQACLDALADEAVGAAGLAYSAPHDGTWVQHFYDLLRSRPEARSETEWLSAGNLAMRRELFIGLSGFDETLEACEDVDLCVRIRRAGLRVVAEPGMASVHHGDPPTLRALFLGELWRGRDNLRVSFRGPVTLRAVPGVVLPVLTLTMLAALPVSLAATVTGRPGVLAVNVLALGVVAIVRASIIARRGRLRSAVSLVRSLAVAAVFELGRALALLGRATHRTRTGTQPA